MATQVRVAGLVSFTTKVSSVIFTSGGSEQGGGGEGCSQFCMHSTCHSTYVGMYVHTSVDGTQMQARSLCALVDTNLSVGAMNANLPNTCSSVVMLPNPTLFTAEQV